MLRARRSFLIFALGLAAAAVVPSARALAQQSWPTRSVRFIVTLGPGSGTDIGGRLVADRLAKKWGQPVVIENKPGGDGIVAISAFVGAKDDHILLLSPTSAFTAHPYLHDNLPYKPEDLGADRADLQHLRRHHRAGRLAGQFAERTGCRDPLQARRTELGWRHRREWLHLRGLAQGHRPRHEEGAVPQSGRGSARPRGEPRPGLSVGGRHCAAADRGGEDQIARRDQQRAPAGLSQCPDGVRGGASRPYHRRAGRAVRAAEHADRRCASKSRPT